eukprot:1362932-Amorphochlora_amoeboformis.AAC.1
MTQRLNETEMPTLASEDSEQDWMRSECPSSVTSGWRFEVSHTMQMKDTPEMETEFGLSLGFE